jgi:hypothetical protein
VRKSVSDLETDSEVSGHDAPIDETAWTLTERGAWTSRRHAADSLRRCGVCERIPIIPVTRLQRIVIKRATVVLLCGTAVGFDEAGERIPVPSVYTQGVVTKPLHHHRVCAGVARAFHE